MVMMMMLLLMMLMQAVDTSDGDDEDDDALHAVDECSMRDDKEEVDKHKTGKRATGTIISHWDGEDVYEDDGQRCEEDHQEMTNYADDIR